MSKHICSTGAVTLMFRGLTITYVFLIGVQRSCNARANTWFHAPLPNSGCEQWRMVVIFTGYTLLANIIHFLGSTIFVFIVCFKQIFLGTTKIGGALPRIPLVATGLSSQLQNLGKKGGVERTQHSDSAVHNCNNLRQGKRSNSSRTEMVCGWDRRYPGLILWSLLNYTRIENAHKVRKQVSLLTMWLSYLQLLGEQMRACVSHYDQSAWPSSKLCTLCKHRCAAASAHIQCCQINKRNRKLSSSKWK